MEEDEQKGVMSEAKRRIHLRDEHAKQCKIVKEESYGEVSGRVSNTEIVSDFSKRNFGKATGAHTKLE